MSQTPAKRFLSYEELADLMLSRNLIADKDMLISRLRAVNYYRLTGYLAPFRERVPQADGSLSKGENYRAGTTLELVWQYYLFDRRLRFLLMDAIERIEIAMRTHIAHYWAEAEGCINPHAFRTSFNTAFEGKNQHQKLLDKMQESYERSILDCVMHHKNKGITNVQDLPVWVMLELTTIGELVWIFSGLKEAFRTEIARKLGIADVHFFHSLLVLIHQARNCCAHHSRVWNVSWLQLLGKSSTMTKKNMLPIVRRVPAEWNLVWNGNTKVWEQQSGAVPPVVSKTSTAFLLMACSHLLKQVAPTSSWHQRFMELMNRPETPYQAMHEMGLPRNWRAHPFLCRHSG